jgi:hypothetical protein
MAEKVLKTRNDYIQSGLRMYKSLVQYRDWSEDDLWVKASEYADQQMEEQAKRLAGKKITREDKQDDDAGWRENRIAAYKDQFDWNDANDLASLEGLVSLEMQIRVVTRELEDPNTTESLLKDLRVSLANLTKEHRTLQRDLGIDRNTRQKERSQRNIVDDWDRIKAEAKEKLETLIVEFAEEANKVETEAELRDRLKYHFAIPFSAVDDVLRNHRRVLGLDAGIQES